MLLYNEGVSITSISETPNNAVYIGCLMTRYGPRVINRDCFAIVGITLNGPIAIIAHIANNPKNNSINMRMKDEGTSRPVKRIIPTHVN